MSRSGGGSRRRIAALGLLAVAAGCAGRPAALCSGAGLAVRADFAQARLSACSVAPDGRIAARVAPETAPVNPSPWYAFAIEGARGGATVSLAYDSARHRYHPWVRERRGAWRRLPDAAVASAGADAEIRLPPSRGPLVVAAQPFPDPAEILGAWERRAARGAVRAETAGKSVDGRPVRLFLHRPPRPEGLVVLIARQHPPEISGGLAFDALAARLLDASPEARAFRARHAILFAPLMNPDGLARGHWRGNAAGADLNRDWGPFAQPETRGVAGRVAALVQAGGPALLLDLHSTRRNVLYAHPLDFAPNAATEGFLAAFGATDAGRGWPVLRRHQDRGGSPGAFKAWTWEALRQPSITFEVADSATPEQAAAIGRAAADAIIATLARSETG
jgi:murein tripeptide amidase MpaA